MMTRTQLLIEIRALIVDESLSSAPEAILSLIEKNSAVDDPAVINLIDTFYEEDETEYPEEEYDYDQTNYSDDESPAFP